MISSSDTLYDVMAKEPATLPCLFSILAVMFARDLSALSPLGALLISAANDSPPIPHFISAEAKAKQAALSPLPFFHQCMHH